jgi:hypothetical protein
MKTALFRKESLVALIVGHIIFSSCSPGILSGQMVKESRSLPEFKRINLCMSADVTISQGENQQVEIEADQQVIELIETSLKDNTLTIKTKNSIFQNRGSAKIHITIPVIESLSVTGSGDITGTTPIHADEIEIFISGSGSVTLQELAANDVSTTITGSGNILLVGTSPVNGKLEGTITGSGDLDTEKLPVENADITITGSGTANVTALRELETNITGSGSVYYKGNPRINSSSTGSGRTKAME